MGSNAFDSIYREHFARLVNYADRIVHDSEAAHSVVQGVFVRLWERKEKLDSLTSLRAYLFRAVYNACINSLEHKRITDILRDDRWRDFYFTTVVQSPDAEQLMSDKEINDAIEEAVASLPARCREIFVMSKMQGCKNHEIAKKLNISEKTVEAQMSIALHRLREKLQWLLVLIFFA